MNDGFNERERRIALALMQIKGEPFCTDCGAGCLVVLEDVSPEQASDLWTACTACGNEMVWRVTPNHGEMLKRMVQLTDMKKGRVLEPHQFVLNVDGTCKGLCGGVCHIHWRPDDEDNTDDSTSSTTVLKPF